MDGNLITLNMDPKRRIKCIIENPEFGPSKKSWYIFVLIAGEKTKWHKFGLLKCSCNLIYRVELGGEEVALMFEVLGMHLTFRLV